MFRNIAVSLTGDGRSLGATLRQGAAQVDDFGNRVERSNTRSQASFLKTAAATAAVVVSLHAMTLGFNATVGASAAFDQRMRNVNSIAHASEGSLRSLSSTTLALSRTLPQSANTLAEGLYDIASSGFQGAKGVTVLDASARAASAGLTSTANAAKAIAGSLNAYGLSASSAKDVSDTLFQTVNLGVLSFEDLTQGIGQVIGTAAAAGVSLDQMGQAVATLTLAGQEPAEAFTALNQLLAEIIQPGKELKAVFNGLGYESGAAALKAKGLQGVMRDLASVTGGDVTQTSALFTNIRGLRGALGLMSNDGRLYGKVVRDWDSAHKGAGSTARALAEQMKAVSAQWQLLKNQAAAAGIATGTLLLPVIFDLLTGIQGLAQDATPLLVSGLEMLAPLAAAVGGALGNVASILATLLEVTGGVAAGLLSMVAPALLGGLTLLANALEAVTGFLADNKGVAIALASVYAATLLPSLAATTLMFNQLLAVPVVAVMTAYRTATLGSAGAVAALNASLSALITLQAVATLGISAALAVLGVGVYKWQQAGKAAEEFGRKQQDAFNPLDHKKATARIEQLRHVAEQSLKYGKQFEGVGGVYKAGWAEIFGDAGDISRKGLKAAQLMNAFAAQSSNADLSLRELTNTTGLSADALAKLAIANKIDLSKTYGSAKSQAAITQVIDLTKDLERQTGISAKHIEASIGLDTEAVAAFAKAQAEAVGKAVGAFASATDVIGNFSVKTGKGTKSAAAQFTAFVRTTKTDAESFADNIETATRRGLNPTAIASLLEKGPTAAAPVLAQLVGSNSKTMIGMVNDAERQLNRISTRIAEFARLTFLATSADTDDLVKDLGAAMRIASENLSEGAHATAAKVARNLHLPKSEVRAIAEEFGITFQGQLDKQHPTIGVRVKIRNPGYTNLLDSLGRTDHGVRDPVKRAGGGKMSGPGTGTSDSILAAVSTGEWVIRERAASYYGDGLMAAINGMSIPRSAIPRFAGGGQVGGGTTIVRVPVSETSTYDAPINVEHMHVSDIADLRRQESLARLRAGQRSGRSMP